MVLEAPGRMEAVFDEARGLAGLRDAVDYIGRQTGRHGDLVRGLLVPDRVETCTRNCCVRPRRRRPNSAARSAAHGAGIDGG
jgi:hypothetical protein